MARQNRRFRGQILIEEVFLGIVKESDRANYFFEDNQRSSHQGAGVKLHGNWELRIANLISEDRAALTHSFGCHGALIGFQSQTEKVIAQFPVGLLSDEFVASLAAPEINAGNLKESAGGSAEELNERLGIGAAAGLSGNEKEEFLEGLIRAGRHTGVRGNDRPATGNSNCCARTR